MQAQRLVQRVFTRRFALITNVTTTTRSSALIQNLIRKAFSPRYLLITNTVSCGTLLGVADYMVQKFENRWAGKAGQPVDWNRISKIFIHKKFQKFLNLVRVTAVGCLWGPMNHVWYRFLDRRIVGGNMGQVVAKKVFADFLVSPIFVMTFLAGITFYKNNLLNIILGTALLEHKPISVPINEYRRKFFNYMTVKFKV